MMIHATRSGCDKSTFSDKIIQVREFHGETVISRSKLTLGIIFSLLT